MAGATLSVEVIHPNFAVPQQALPPAMAIAESVLSSTGAGFGDAETNAIVEKAAIDCVTAEYAGWHVRDVSKDNLGYDLECTRGGETRHVEVKGIGGSLEEFVITRNEVDAAETDPHFVLAVVTLARSDSRLLNEYTGPEMRERFGFTPIAYRARPKPSDR